MEFHISRQARDRYQFDLSLFTTSGNVILANFHHARTFAQKMNARRDLVNFPEQAVQAGQINAMGLIDEILHLVIETYRRERNPQVNAQALAWLEEKLGKDAVDQALRRFAAEFPPIAVYRREISLEDYFAGSTGEMSHREVELEEMLMLWLANLNPAYAPYLELFEDADLERDTAYPGIMESLRELFATQPGFGPEGQNLIDLLRSPALASPHSLAGQLEFIRRRWSFMLGKHLYRLLTSLDLIKEEEKAIFFGPGPALVYEFAGLEKEPERFSPDRDWMPNLVLLAKNTYVWLDQLSKTYQANLTRLDQIPDEELDRLASRGFTGLWLIGLWERSPASRRIKQLRGNPEAVASAYSLFSYDIAADLGGEEAYQNLCQRAWQRGIRLASDMVPNHMGIDSRWVIEHPDWFIALDYSPFPSYTFNGPNLSWDSRVAIYLEDHYYNNTDAAVVFKRVDTWSGEEKYIYHGNDGTSMPWNDTAQLNYLKAEVREAVIQTILHVARKFPIIRFDAAMTLAKRHYQRLWFPEPGSGGAIPSRAEHGLTKAQFDAAMPVEFWREVVDRVAQEAPDTLLLAEAFWLMEGYFVRSLGMHRVYNSAFMNMLRDEKNQEYRLVIKNTLEFDPEILKRYVNFMNNPDERTAVEQFGKGDKYFGICTLMCTLPGLPMFGHGQIEGFAEKYGMEYRKAYWDEQPDGYLIERHAREIFPLLKRRYLFAEAANFLLYDFRTADGTVNEDVFAYSNRAGDERALVIYHNRFAEARGWIKNSTAYPLKKPDGTRELQFKPLAEGLNLSRQPGVYTIFRDLPSGLQYIRNNQELWERGLYIELAAYQYHVFLDFQQVQDDEWGRYSHLCSYLNGRGVPNIEEALREIFLQPVHIPFRELVNAGQMRWLMDHRLEGATPAVMDEVTAKVARLLAGVQAITASSAAATDIVNKIQNEVGALLTLQRSASGKGGRRLKPLDYLIHGPTSQASLGSGDAQVWGALLAWVFTHRLGELVNPQQAQQISRAWIDELLLDRLIRSGLAELGLDEAAQAKAASLVRLMISHQTWFEDAGDKDRLAAILERWLQDGDVQRFLQINRYQGVLWFNKEAFEELLWYLYAANLLLSAGDAGGAVSLARLAQPRYRLIRGLLAAEKESAYQVQKLLSAVSRLGQSPTIKRPSNIARRM